MEQMNLTPEAPVMQDALLDEEGGVPDAADSNNDAEPDGLALHSMPHQARAAVTGHANHAAHEVYLLHHNSPCQAALSYLLAARCPCSG